MFDIGFSELLLFGAIALIILGPEKLPQAARTAGRYYAKFRRTVANLQSEIEAELDLLLPIGIAGFKIALHYFLNKIVL